MTTQRIFIPGDKWVYLKVYTGFKSADFLLKEIFYPLSEFLLSENMISQWFFIRYSDPQFHLRIRFLLTDIKKYDYLIHKINESMNPFVSSEVIWKIQYDTYQRELERYGANTIEIAESIFFRDSIMIAKLLYNTDDEEQRWLWSLKMVDVLLNDFQYNIQKKYSILTKIHDDFKKEFQITQDYYVQFGKKYREYKIKIEKIMTFPIELSEISPITEKSQQIKSYVSKILHLEHIRELEVSVDYLLSSYIHMMFNRWFRSKQRIYELIIYDFLFRYYESMVKRTQNGKKT